MSKIRRLAGETVLYGLGSILPRFLGFLLVRLHTDVFPAEDYGVLTKVFGFSAVIMVVFQFGMETAYFRFANRKDLDEPRVFNLAQTVVTGLSVGLSALLLIFIEPVSKLLLIEGEQDLLRILIFILLIDAVVSIPFARLRFQKKPTKFAILKLINITLVVGLNVYLLKFSPWQPDVSFVLIANLVANATYLLFFIPELFAWRPTFDRGISGEMFRYAYPVMITGLAGMTNEMFSRTTLEYWLPDNFYADITKKQAVGIFGAVYRFAVLMNLAIMAFRYAAEPFFFSQSSEKNSPQLFARVNHYFTLACCILLFSVSVNLEILKYFLGKPIYWQGLHIVPVLLLAYLFLGVYYNISAWFKITDRTYWGTVITFGGMVITIIGNYFLIPIWGYTGSAIAALGCYAMMTVCCYLLGQKYYPVPYTIGKDFIYVVTTILLIYAVAMIPVEDNVTGFIVHNAIVVLFIFFVVIIEWKGLKKPA